MPFENIPPTNGTVTNVSVTTANGVSGTVANSTTTPAITVVLGNITPSNVTLPDTGKLAFNNSGTAFSGKLSAPTGVMAADVELMLPNIQGSMNQALINLDGLGQLGWGNAGASTGYVDNAVGVLNGKQVVDLIGFSNVTLSGIQTVDGVATSSASIVCLGGQTDPTENGLWSVSDIAAWTRPSGWASGIAAVPGSLISVSSNSGGVDYSNTLWFGQGDGSATSSFQRVPVALSTNTGWGSITNVSADKAYNANATTVDELADVLGTLIAQLIAQGILRA